MGIRGLQTFIRETFDRFDNIELHNCNVILDGNSIYHQMYKECELPYVFGGEYDQFYEYCMQLFKSFEKCQINAIVVFDGAQLDSRKRSTNLERAKQSVENSMATDSKKISISPILLRQTFISVLDTMQIPYISALGEADEECVSLANHFDCYLMATDSDYFCYDLHHGYIPFESVDIEPEQRNGIVYLTVQSYHINSLLGKFKGLQQQTLALACCLCGNDYIDRTSTKRIIRYMNDNVETPNRLQNSQSRQTINLWNAMEYMRKINNVDDALDHLLTEVSIDSSNEIKKKIEEAVLCYLEPSDTLFYRFNPSKTTNPNLIKNPIFVQLAQSYFDTHGVNENQLGHFIDEFSQSIKSKHNHSLPLFLADATTDLRLSPEFIEIFIHRELICKSPIEVRDRLSVFNYAIPITLPCFAILLKRDQEPNDLSIVIHHRQADKLAEHRYLINNHDNDIPELEHIWSTMPIDKRQDFVRKYLKISDELLKHLEVIPADFHLWFMIIHYWYIKCNVSLLYLYAIFICFIKYVFLRTDYNSELMKDQFDSLLTNFKNQESRQSIDLSVHEKIFEDFKKLSERDSIKDNFNRRTVYELNCLQAIYMYTLRLNDFFDRPFPCPIYPQYFISGSLFYGFVKYCQTKHYIENMANSMDNLFGKKTFLTNLLHNLVNLVRLVNPENDA